MYDPNQTIDYPYEDQSAQKKNQNNTLIIVVVVVLILLCCCCTVVGLVLAWFYGDAVLEMLGIGLTYFSGLSA